MHCLTLFDGCLIGAPPQKKMKMEAPKTNPIHTVGHSSLSAESLMGMLKRRGITRVIDVRSTPYSRHVPHFNRENIRATLEKNNASYTHMGDILGGRPREERLYDRDGRADYSLMAQEKPFQDAIRQVEQMAEDGHIALMCTEADPLRCHRTLLVSQELASRGAEIIHLIRDGQQERHEETMGKLLMVWKLLRDGEAGMTRRQLIEEAVRRQAAEVAYRRR